MLDRRRLEIATSNASLGMLADDVLIAIFHYLSGVGLDHPDRHSLQRALGILRAVTELDTRQVATGSILRTMAPLGALEETLVQVTNASGGADTDNLGSLISIYIAELEAVLNNTAENDQVQHIKDLFERLAESTLSQSEDVVRPSRDDRQEWINKALNS